MRPAKRARSSSHQWIGDSKVQSLSPGVGIAAIADARRATARRCAPRAMIDADSESTVQLVVSAAAASACGARLAPGPIMPNTNAKKLLVLNRETVANLTGPELDAVQGGISPSLIPITAASLRWCVAAAPAIAAGLEKVGQWLQNRATAQTAVGKIGRTVH